VGVVPELPPLKVLVVDDDEDNRRILCRFLPAPPLEVVTAADGHAAIEAATAAAPDVVLLDLEMPVMDGLEAATRLRALERATGRARARIIGFSAHTDEATRARSLAAGCDLYLAKPVSRAVLLRTLWEMAPVHTSATPDPSPNEPVVIDPDLAGIVADFSPRAARRSTSSTACSSRASGDTCVASRTGSRAASACTDSTGRRASAAASRSAPSTRSAPSWRRCSRPCGGTSQPST
jgi:CheY-like chemotaxis protein